MAVSDHVMGGHYVLLMFIFLGTDISETLHCTCSFVSTVGYSYRTMLKFLISFFLVVAL